MEYYVLAFTFQEPIKQKKTKTQRKKTRGRNKIHLLLGLLVRNLHQSLYDNDMHKPTNLMRRRKRRKNRIIKRTNGNNDNKEPLQFVQVIIYNESEQQEQISNKEKMLQIDSLFRKDAYLMSHIPFGFS